MLITKIDYLKRVASKDPDDVPGVGVAVYLLGSELSRGHVKEGDVRILLVLDAGA